MALDALLHYLTPKQAAIGVAKGFYNAVAGPATVSVIPPKHSAAILNTVPDWLDSRTGEKAALTHSLTAGIEEAFIGAGGAIATVVLITTLDLDAKFFGAFAGSAIVAYDGLGRLVRSAIRSPSGGPRPSMFTQGLPQVYDWLRSPLVEIVNYARLRNTTDRHTDSP